MSRNNKRPLPGQHKPRRGPYPGRPDGTSKPRVRKPSTKPDVPFKPRKRNQNVPPTRKKP